MRSGYSDDCTGAELGRWRANVNRALQGQRGQAFLREMLTALDALPEPRLIDEYPVDGDDCCAMGAVARARGVDVSRIDATDRADVAAVFNIAPVMAAEIASVNDADFSYRSETPEQRFARVRAWVVAEIKDPTTC